jgi:hypothetical protein
LNQLVKSNRIIRLKTKEESILDENVEYVGEWWLPEKPNQRFSGKLIVSSENRGNLYLHAFQLKTLDLPERKTDLILGCTLNGKKITLYQCYLKNKKSHYGEASTEEYEFFSVFIFIGVHFTKVEDITFKKINVQYLNLKIWADISGFKIPPYWKKNRISIKFALPKSIDIATDGVFQISVSFSASPLTLTHPQTEVAIEQNTWISFTPSTSQKLEEYMNMMQVMQNFLTLAMSEPTYPVVLEGQSESEKVDLEGTIIYPEIKIFFLQPIYKSPELESLSRYNMLFTLKEILSRKKVVKNWFKKRELLQPACDAYFSTLYQRGMYLNNKLLNLTQALESYHRRVMKNIELPKKEHEKRIKKILENAPSVYTDWLDGKLKYSNEPTLRKRLKDIWNQCPPNISGKLGTKNTFIDKTVNTRNYWTHLDDDNKSKAATGIELSYLTLKLRILIVVCFLKEMGFTPDEIEGLMSKPLAQI